MQHLHCRQVGSNTVEESVEFRLTSVVLACKKALIIKSCFAYIFLLISKFLKFILLFHKTECI